MITMWDVYWITRLDGIQGVLLAGVAITVFAVFVWGFIMGPLDVWEDNEERHPLYIKQLIMVVAIGIALIILLVLVPSTKTAVAIYMVPKIANNEQVQKLPVNVMEFLNKKLEGWIADMKDKK